jgi:hypothetical protein
MEEGVINYRESCYFLPKQEKGKNKSFVAAKPKYEKFGLKSVRPQILERKVSKKLRQKNRDCPAGGRVRSVYRILSTGTYNHVPLKITTLQITGSYLYPTGTSTVPYSYSCYR